MNTPRFAFAAIVSRQHDGREFGIGLAQENAPGYWPQPGFGSFPTWTQASDKARRLNTIQGLTDADAAQIVASSMRKTTKPKAQRMNPPPNTTPSEKPPADAAEDNHFDGDGPRGDDRPAPLDACGDQGITVSTTALSEFGPVLASILAAKPAP